MEALVFPNEEALRVALTSGLVPADVHRAPARVVYGKDGSVEVSPAVALSAEARAALEAAGVTARAASTSADEVSCWAELVPPRRDDVTGELGEVLFTVSPPGSLLDLAGELLRLGCDRLELRLLGAGATPSALLRAVEPPWFVVSRAMDRLDGLAAFLPSPPGQQATWTELGFRHPLADALAAPDAGLVLIRGDGPWWRLPGGEWTDASALVTPSGVSAPKKLPARAKPPRFTVPLTLGRASRQEPPTLFVVPDGVDRVEALVRSMPEAELEHLLFAVVEGAVLLRVRPGHEAAAAALPGEAFARVADLPNLYAPFGMTVEPPLRRDRLREWLAPDPDAVTWLAPGKDGISARSVPDAAFRPLPDWVDYVLSGAAQELAAWAKTAVFDFEPFDVQPEPVEPARSPRARAQAEDDLSRAAEDDRHRSAPPSPPAASAGEREEASTRPAPPSGPRARRNGDAPKPPEEAPPPPSRPSSPPLHLPPASEAEQALAREEASFLELEVAADAPERRAGWVRLAELYTRAQRYRDAGQAWAMALWTAPDDEAPALARRWADTSPVKFGAALSLTAPTAEHTRGAVAHLLSAALEGGGATTSRLPEWAGFLDRFDNDLDVRSVWLGRYAVSTLSGGDALLMARARDRVLARLQRGLSVERDVPRLLLLAGRSEGGVLSERVRQVAQQLESVFTALEKTPRKRTPTEAPPHLTHAYVSFEFAWGFARLGLADRARELRDVAAAGLDGSDDVHGYFVRAYGARIDQALEGVSPDTPLPADITARLNHLSSLHRYQVERLRAVSEVLSSEHVKPFTLFAALSRPHHSEELATLRGVTDPKELLKKLEARTEVARDPKLNAEERSRLIDGMLDYLPGLPESSALPLLTRLVGDADVLPPEHKVPVLEDALMVAGHFGRTQLVQRYVKMVGTLLRELGPEGVVKLGATLTAGVRSLRRVGLREEAQELLARAGAVLKGDDVATLQARLALAAGFGYLGAWERAAPTVDEAHGVLARESGLPIVERLKLTRATARALSSGPTDAALSGLSRLLHQLPWVTDSYNTNDHFCLSVVDFADALVLGHVGDDLTLAESTRRFLEEDEHLVRRRVHRDVHRLSH